MSSRSLRRAGFAALLAAAAILGSQAPAQETELERYLQGKSFDRDKLLSQFEEDREVDFQAAPDAVSGFDSSTIALILPLDAPGLVGEVANAFLEGFVQAAAADGEILELETYRTDGQPQSGLAAYRQAVGHGAGLIVGPLLRSAVEQVAALPAPLTAPTLLLQEPVRATHAGQVGAAPLYSFPLGGEMEALQFAGSPEFHVEDARIYILVEDSPLGRRLETAFLRAWRLAGRTEGAVIRTMVGEGVWTRVHDEVRADIKDDFDEKELEELELAEPPELPSIVAVFAAGGSEFASQARANMPTAVPVYVLSTSQDGISQGGRNILVLSGIRFYEMPYVIDLRAGRSDLIAAGYSASLTPQLQRYVAAGIDAYEIASSYPVWGRVGRWSHPGATGGIELDGGRFGREGRLMELSEGIYTDITPEPGEAPAEQGADGG